MLRTGLRIGIYLLSTSSLGVLYRNADMTYSMHPALKWFCLGGLTISLICFVITYLRVQNPSLLKSFTQRVHMIKSPSWKLSSMA
jgi:hypothetical protein